MSALINLPFAWAAVLAVIAATEQARFEKILPLADQIAPGDSQAEVLEVLGRPQGQWESPGLFTSGPPTWAYGLHIELADIIRSDSQFPEPLPIKFRLFGPYEDDLTIVWSKDGVVESITKPKR